MSAAKPLDVWLKFDQELASECDLDDELATHEANTYVNDDGSYRVEWYLNSVGQVTRVHFDTLAQAYSWYAHEGFENFTS